jgi:hypothetical protein
MRPTPRARPPQASPAFSDRVLTELLRALRARSSEHPDNPGLIASWPGVTEEHMAAACAELRRRGHPVFPVDVEGARGGPTRKTWAVAGVTDEPVRSL